MPSPLTPSSASVCKAASFIEAASNRVLATGERPLYYFALPIAPRLDQNRRQSTLQRVACDRCYTVDLDGESECSAAGPGAALVLPAGTQLLLLRATLGSDQSRSSVTRRENESDASYGSRVEYRTLERLWERARNILRQPSIRDSLRSGLTFRMALEAPALHYTHYFEQHSEALVAEALLAESLSS